MEIEVYQQDRPPLPPRGPPLNVRYRTQGKIQIAEIEEHE